MDIQIGAYLTQTEIIKNDFPKIPALIFRRERERENEHFGRLFRISEISEDQAGGPQVAAGLHRKLSVGSLQQEPFEMRFKF